MTAELVTLVRSHSEEGHEERMAAHTEKARKRRRRPLVERVAELQAKIEALQLKQILVDHPELEELYRAYKRTLSLVNRADEPDEVRAKRLQKRVDRKLAAMAKLEAELAELRTLMSPEKGAERKARAEKVAEAAKTKLLHAAELLDVDVSALVN